MISIEAHRAAIGRFSRKARSITQIGACSKTQWIDTTLLILLTKKEKMILLEILQMAEFAKLIG